MKPNANRVTADQAEANAEAITRFYTAGADSLRNCGVDDFAHGSRIAGFAEEIARLESVFENLPVKLGPDSLAKVRRVAAEYDREAILTLAALVRHNCSRFAVTHLFALLPLEDRKLRTRLAERAIRASWSVDTLSRHIRVARNDRRAASGRRPHVPADPKQILLVLEELAIKWLRFTRRAFADKANRPPRRLLERIRSADAAVESVHLGILKALKRPPSEGTAQGRAEGKSARPSSASGRTR